MANGTTQQPPPMGSDWGWNSVSDVKSSERENIQDLAYDLGDGEDELTDLEKSTKKNQEEYEKNQKAAANRREKQQSLDKSRAYESDMRYMDPNETGGIDIKYTNKGNAYIIENGKNYKLKFSTNKDEINYTPTSKYKKIDYNEVQDLAAKEQGYKSSFDKDMATTDKMYEEIEKTQEEIKNETRVKANWETQGYKSSDDYYDMMNDRGDYSMKKALGISDKGLLSDMGDAYGDFDNWVGDVTGLNALRRTVMDGRGDYGLSWAKDVAKTGLDLLPTSEGYSGKSIYGQDRWSGADATLDALVGASLVLPVGKGFGIGKSAVPKGAPNITPKPVKKLKPIESSVANKSTNVSSAFKNIKATGGELWGKALRGKKNQKAVDKGNKWLNDWIQHPTTQSKIDESVVKAVGKGNQALEGSELRQQWHNMAGNIDQAKSYTPNVSRYSTKSHLSDLFHGAENVHADNLGVSYRHSTTGGAMRGKGYGKMNVESGSTGKIGLGHKDYGRGGRFGTWTSDRNFGFGKSGQFGRESTTIHEGTHDWVTSEILWNSGMGNRISNSLKPLSEVKFGNTKGVNSYSTYMAKPTEIQSRIMELRRMANLKPDDVVTVDGIKALKNMNKEVGKVDKDFFNLFKSDKSLAELFNKNYVGAGAIGGTGATILNK